MTLLNTVSGVTVNLGEGTANTLNLAAGNNSFDNLWTSTSSTAVRPTIP